MKEHVALLQAQLLQSDQVIADVKDQLWGLEEEVAQLQADQVALQLQLELDSTNVRLRTPNVFSSPRFYVCLASVRATS